MDPFVLVQPFVRQKPTRQPLTDKMKTLKLVLSPDRRLDSMGNSSPRITNAVDSRMTNNIPKNDIDKLFASDSEDLSDHSPRIESPLAVIHKENEVEDDQSDLTDIDSLLSQSTDDLSNDRMVKVGQVRFPQSVSPSASSPVPERRSRRRRRGRASKKRKQTPKREVSSSLNRTPSLLVPNSAQNTSSLPLSTTLNASTKHSASNHHRGSNHSANQVYSRPKPLWLPSILPPNPFLKKGDERIKEDRALAKDLEDMKLLALESTRDGKTSNDVKLVAFNDTTKSMNHQDGESIPVIPVQSEAIVSLSDTMISGNQEENRKMETAVISPSHKGVKSTVEEIDGQKKLHSVRLGLIDSSITAKRTSIRTLQKPVSQYQDPFQTLHSQSALEQSDDYCAVCLGRGKLVCCDSCVRVFHLACLKESLDSDALPDFWECYRCRARRERSRSPTREEPLKDKEISGSIVNQGMNSDSRMSSRRNKKLVRPEVVEQLFGPLLSAVEALNPRLFSLPSEIYGEFEGLLPHPLTGDFLNTVETELLDASIPYLWHQRVNPTLKRKPAPAFVSESLSSNTFTIDPLLKVFCHGCSQTNLKLSLPSFLTSHSVPKPLSPSASIQAIKSDMVKCDFCPLYWHLDCLDPPLAVTPPELREDEIEMVNLRTVQALKARIWGRDGVPYEKLSSLSSSSTTHQYHHSDSVSTLTSRTKLPTTDGTISIRKKWMCPCHSSWALPPVSSSICRAKTWRWVDVYEPTSQESKTSVSKQYNDKSVKGNSATGENGNHRSVPSPVKSVESLSKTRTSKRSTVAFDLPPPDQPPSNTSFTCPPPVSDDEEGTAEYILRSRSSMNAGNIDITLDEPFTPPRDEVGTTKRLKLGLHAHSSFETFTIDGIKYRVPERRVKLDFIQKVRQERPGLPPPGARHSVLTSGKVEFDQLTLDRMFPGYDSKFQSRIDGVCDSGMGSLNTLIAAAESLDALSRISNEVKQT